MLGGERGLRELKELLRGQAQGVGRESLEGVGEFCLRTVEQGLFFGGRLQLGVEAGAEFRELVAI